MIYFRIFFPVCEDFLFWCICVCMRVCVWWVEGASSYSLFLQICDAKDIIIISSSPDEIAYFSVLIYFCIFKV